MKGFWTCSRVSGGVKCQQRNANRKRKCERCSKPRPPRRQPAHRKALELPYEEFVKANGGDWCGVCGREGSDTRKLDRDHDHKTGEPRGVLCWRHNKALEMFGDDPELLHAAIDYLERAAAAETTRDLRTAVGDGLYVKPLGHTPPDEARGGSS